MTSARPSDGGLLSRQFLVLALAASIFFFGVGGLNSLLPKFVVDELDGTEATSGIVMGSMAVSALLTRVWFGRVADRRGARRILVMGAALTALSMVVLVAIESVAGAILSRLVGGAGGAAFVTGATMLSIELAPEDRRSQAAAYILIAFHVGLGLGPLAGEAVQQASSYDVVWWSVAGASLVGAAIAGGLLEHRPGDPAAVAGPWIHPSALGPGVVTLLGVAAFNGFLMFVPLYARELGLEDAGIVFAIASITIVVVRVALGRVPDIVGPVPAGTAALGVTIIAAIVIAFWTEPVGLYIGAALVAGGLSLQSPSFIKMAVEGVPRQERGSAMATFTGFYDIAAAVIGPLFGLVIAGFGYRSAFVMSGAFSAAAIVVLWTIVGPSWVERAALVSQPARRRRIGFPPA